MSDAWVGTVNVLAGAMLAGGITLLTAYWTTNRDDHRDALRGAHEREQRLHDDRKAAYVRFACEIRLHELDVFRYMHAHDGKNRSGDEGGVAYRDPDVENAATAMWLLAPRDTTEAVMRYVDELALLEWTLGSVADFHRAKGEFLVAARRDMGVGSLSD